MADSGTKQCNIGYDQDKISTQPKNTQTFTTDDTTMLIEASCSGDYETVKALIQQGVDVNHSGTNGNTAVNYAAQKGHLHVLKLLQESGANIKVVNNDGHTPIMSASLDSGDSETIQWLIGHGVDVNCCSLDGFTAVHCAAYKGKVQVLELLHKHKADIHAQTIDNNNALVMAVQGYSNVNTVKWLIDKGVDVYNTNDEGFSALHYAAVFGQNSLLKHIASYNNNVSAKSKFNITPLMLASFYNHSSTVSLLLECGAEIGTKNVQGKSALDFAVENGFRDIVEILQTHERIDDSMVKWTKNQRQQLVRLCILRILTIGDQGIGKTSLLKSILLGRIFVTGTNDRTVVFDVWSGRLNNGKLILAFDLGGHPGYYYTSHFLHHNSSQNILLFCHSVISDNYDVSFQWLKATLTRSPKCTVIPVLTKADEISLEQIPQAVDEFTKQMKASLKNEIGLLENISAEDDDETIIRSKMETYQSLYDNFESKVFVTSVKQDHPCCEKLKQLCKYIEDLSDKDIYQVKVPKLYVDFYSKLGKIGAMADVEQSTTAIQRDKSWPTLIDAKLLNLTTKSEANTTEKADTQNQLHIEEKTDAHKGTINVTGNKSSEITCVSNYPLPSQQYQTGKKSKYSEASCSSRISTLIKEGKIVLFSDAVVIYTKLSKQYPGSCDDLKACLKQLHSYGMALWFQGNKHIEKYIIFDFDFFKGLLSSLFHHEALEVPFHKIGKILRRQLFENMEDNYKLYIERVKRTGLVSRSLLKVFLHNRNFDEEVETVAQLFQHLNIAYEFRHPSCTEPSLFIPWFVEQKPIPEVLKDRISHLVVCSKDELALNFQLKGSIPSTYWHQFCVEVMHELYDASETQQRIVFRNGLWAIVDNLYLLVQLRENSLKVLIKGQVETDKVHRMWKLTDTICYIMIKLIRTWWPGLAPIITVDCSHCHLRNLRPSDVNEIHQWSLCKSLGAENNAIDVGCRLSSTTSIPSLFVRPPSKDQAMAEKQVAYLKEYLKTNGQHVHSMSSNVDMEGCNFLPDFQNVHQSVLCELADSIGVRWKSVGRRLGLTKGQIDEIVIDNPHHSWDRIYSMLHKWLTGQSGDDETKADTLKKALTASGFKFNDSQLVHVQDSPDVSVGPNPAPHKSVPTPRLNDQDSISFEISHHGATYHFPEENITVVIPTNSLSQSEKTCTAFIKQDVQINESSIDAVSKVYEFLPSGLRTRNRMMFVIPLLPAHNYDYNNMTLMHKEDRDSEFVCVDSMKDNKPTWLFYGNVCYIFLNHFCEIFVKRNDSGIPSQITLQSVLFYKYSSNVLELITTFGCYSDTSVCSTQKVKEMRSAGEFMTMCEFCSLANQWPVVFSHKLSHLAMPKNNKDITIRLFSPDLFDIHLSLDVSCLSSPENVINDDLCNKEQKTWSNENSKSEIKEIFYTHMSAQDMDECAKMLNISPSDTNMCVQEFTEVLLDQFISRDHVPDQIMILRSLITSLTRFNCLKRIKLTLEYVKFKKILQMRLLDLCEEEEMESFQGFLTSENILSGEEHSRLKTYPDKFSRLMYLMRHVILPNEKHCSKLKEFCQKHELEKYVTDNIHVTDEMMTYNKKHYDLPNHCEDCLKRVVKRTLDLQKVIDVLGTTGRGFCNRLNSDIIPRDTAQRIEAAKDDSEALGLIRRALEDSLASDKLDIVLRVLSDKEMGKRMQYEKIKKCYHEQIRQHTGCEKCRLAKT